MNKELIERAKGLSTAATPGPWARDCTGPGNPVFSLDKAITPPGVRLEDATFIAQARTLLPALADLAESEGRRAEDLAVEKQSMREILSDLHKMLTRATDAGPCRITDLVQREIHDLRAAMTQLAQLKGQEP